MTKLCINLLLAAAMLVCAGVGCSRPVEEIAPVAAAPVVTAAVASPAPVEPISSLTSVAAKAQAAEGAEGEMTPAPAVAGEAEAPQAAYQPPFPDRIELFVPPKRHGGMVLTEGGSEDAVELLGFVKLDKPQVVLSINGLVTPIYEGGNQYGIEVISIQPPKVVLQRGRQRWQASLEN
jgi:hypothetical protein